MSLHRWAQQRRTMVVGAAVGADPVDDRPMEPAESRRSYWETARTRLT